jgi:RNA polymerase sigma factor (sigma-70 family)
MSATGLSATVARVRRALAPPADPCPTDGQLLSSFVADRDSQAFALLVRRHGPMVLSVCRRITRHTQDAEDAFQAVFLVLARKAQVVTPREAVGNWLYGVAVLTARQAWATAAKRRGRELPADPLPDVGHTVPEALPADTRSVLDEELARLPDRYRTLVVSCDLEGESQAALARRFGLPVGTVYSRLATARALLAERLRKRGLVPAVALAAVGSAASGPGLSATVARLAGSACHSLHVENLAEAVMRNTVGWKSKLALVVSAWGTAGLLVGGLLAADPPAPPPAPLPAPVVLFAQAPKPLGQPKTAGPGRLLIWKETQHVFLTPDGKEDGTLPGHPDNRILGDPVFSPDGERVAFVAHDDPPTDDQGHPRNHLFVRTTDGKGDGKTIALNATNVCWNPDGKALIAAEYVTLDDATAGGIPHWSIDPATGEKTRLELPKLAHVHAVMPDGKAFVAALYDIDAKKVHLALVSRDGKDVTRLCELRTEGPRPRPPPDGTRILFQDYDPKAKKPARLEDVPRNALLLGYCWSPDGKKIAYTWKQVQPGVPLAFNTENSNDPKLRTETESHLVVCDATGKNPKTLLTLKAPAAPQVTIGAVDWR